MARPKQNKKASQEGIDPLAGKGDEQSKPKVTTQDNIVWLADFRAKCEGRPKLAARYKFDLLPLVPVIALSGWYSAKLEVLDADYFRHLSVQRDQGFRPGFVLAQISLESGQAFVFETKPASDERFCWPQQDDPIAIVALFRLDRYNGQKASRLVEIMDGAMVAVAA